MPFHHAMPKDALREVITIGRVRALKPRLSKNNVTLEKLLLKRDSTVLTCIEDSRSSFVIELGTHEEASSSFLRF